jgi:hypothetical protein
VGPVERDASIDELMDRAVAAINRGDRVTTAIVSEVLAVDEYNADAEDLLASPGGEPLLARRRARHVRHRVEGDELARQRISAGGNGFDDALLLRRQLHRRIVMARMGHGRPAARWPPSAMRDSGAPARSAHPRRQRPLRAVNPRFERGAP